MSSRRPGSSGIRTIPGHATALTQIERSAYIEFLSWQNPATIRHSVLNVRVNTTALPYG